MIIKNGHEILPGWVLEFKEVSNNVYKVTLTDKFGRQSSTTDTNLEDAIKTCECYAFEIERQISRNWTKFLFDLCILRIDAKRIVEKEYHEDSFGSWYIIIKNRILLDNKDGMLCIQAYNDIGWVNIKISKLKELTFEIFASMINSVK